MPGDGRNFSKSDSDAPPDPRQLAQHERTCACQHHRGATGFGNRLQGRIGDARIERERVAGMGAEPVRIDLHIGIDEGASRCRSRVVVVAPDHACNERAIRIEDPACALNEPVQTPDPQLISGGDSL